MSLRSSTLAALLIAGFLPGNAHAQVEEWFFDKAISYHQSENDTAPTEAIAWVIELAVLTSNPGDALTATISGGGIAGELDLEWDDGEWLYEEEFESQSAMDALFPSGQAYTITLSGGTLGTVSQTFNLGPAEYPPAPYLTGDDLTLAINIPAGSGHIFHWNDPGPSTTSVGLEIEDPMTEREIGDFEYDEAPLPTSQLVDSLPFIPGHLFSGYLSFRNTNTYDGAGGFGVEGYSEHSSNLAFEGHQLLTTAPDELVGAWQFGDSTSQDSGVLIFQGDGTYFHIEDPAPGSDGTAGVEMGTYQRNGAVAGGLIIHVLFDNNGDIGLSHPNGTDIFAVNGNTLSITDNDETSVLTRVEYDPANLIVGAWRLVDNADNNTAVLVFLDNGYYFHGEVTDDDPAGQPGIERGTYTLTGGNLTANPITDTNLQLGLSDPIIGFDDLTITDNVSMKLYDGEPFTLRRISNASILPDWRINKGRNFNQTAADTAPSVPVFWDAWAYVKSRHENDIGSVTISGGGLATPQSFTAEGEGEWTFEKDYPNQAALDAEFPDLQVFTFTITGGALGTRIQTINLGSKDYPTAPYLTGTIFDDARSLDPAAEFTFEWNEDPAGSSSQLVVTSEPGDGGEEYFYMEPSTMAPITTEVTIPANTIPAEVQAYGYLQFGVIAYDEISYGAFGVSGFSARISTTQDFIIDTRTGDDGGFGDAAADAGLAGEDALPNATPFEDGVDNLLKFAFNMDLSGFDNGTLAPGGDSGLPTFELKDEDGASTFELEFIRRVGSSLTYTPQRSDTLSGFATMTGAVTITPIPGGEFERVTVSEPCDPAVQRRCFGRVLVSAP